MYGPTGHVQGHLGLHPLDDNASFGSWREHQAPSVQDQDGLGFLPEGPSALQPVFSPMAKLIAFEAWCPWLLLLQTFTFPVSSLSTVVASPWGFIPGATRSLLSDLQSSQ